MPLEKGLIHVYTGEGKGKTTAALGQAFRACGRGLNVLVHQFFKLDSEPSGEMAFNEALKDKEGVDGLKAGHLIFRRGDFRHPFFDKDADRAVLRGKLMEALARDAAEMKAGFWDLVVLDEINNALRDKLVLWDEFEAVLDERPPQVELICTGRGAPDELLAIADYVTEMKLHKHPFQKQIAARKGIEF